MVGQNPETSPSVYLPHSGVGSEMLSLSALAELYPHPNNTLVGLLTAAYSVAPAPSVDRPAGPLQPHQILTIVDDVLRELDGEITEDEESN